MILTANESRHKTIHTIELHLDEVQEPTKWMNGDGSSDGDYHLGWQRGWLVRGIDAPSGGLEMFYILVFVVLT